MNRRMVFHTVGLIVLLETGLLAIPAAVSLIYREKSFLAFLFSMAIAACAGCLLFFLVRPKSKLIYAK